MLGMQRVEWGAPQSNTYSHAPHMQQQGSPWAMMGPPAQDNLLPRSTASRRFFSESMEYTPEVMDTGAAAHTNAPCSLSETCS